MHIQFGQRVRDKITSFEGVVTGRAAYISGCSQLLIAPPVDSSTGSFRDSQWFDEQRIEAIDGITIVLENGSTPGPDRAAPKR